MRRYRRLVLRTIEATHQVVDGSAELDIQHLALRRRNLLVELHGSDTCFFIMRDFFGFLTPYFRTMDLQLKRIKLNLLSGFSNFDLDFDISLVTKLPAKL